MTSLPPAIIPILVSSIMSAADRGSISRYTVYGLVTDEKGNNINGADVLVESTVERKRTISSGDGRFLTDIRVSGSFDEIVIIASCGSKSCTEKVSADIDPKAIDIIIHDNSTA